MATSTTATAAPRPPLRGGHLPRRRHRRLAQEPVRPLHPDRPAAGRHPHPGSGVLERHQHHQPAAADVDHRRGRAGRADRRADRRHRHLRRLRPRAGRGHRRRPVRRPLGAPRPRRGPGHRRPRRRRERLAGRLPRPGAVHRHPGHARPGPRPGLRLRQRHPDQPRRRRLLRRVRPDHGPRYSRSWP